MAETERGGNLNAGPIMVVAAALMSIGVIMVASTTLPIHRSFFDTPFWQTTFGRQSCFLLSGLITMGLASRLAPPMLSRPGLRRALAGAAFLLVVAMLVMTLVPGLGESQRGSQRWLRLGSGWSGLGFQPSEFAKLGLVFFLAWLLGDRHVDLRSFRSGFLPAASAVGLCVLLVGKADFGTAVLLAAVGGAVMLVAGCRFLHLAAMAILGTGALATLLIMAPYRMARLTAFADIWADPQGAGYQPLQSLAAIASGGWLGKGLGAGIQKHGYLPESHSDFVFSVICEEAGLLGGVLVLALFCVLVWLGLRIMWTAGSRIERLLAFGITATIGLQAAMNIAVVTVMAPTTGISLPLISAGGSGVLMFSAAIGLLAGIAARTAAGHRSSIESRAFLTGNDRRWHAVVGEERTAW